MLSGTFFQSAWPQLVGERMNLMVRGGIVQGRGARCRAAVAFLLGMSSRPDEIGEE